MKVQLASTPEEVAACVAVLRQLRPQLAEAELTARIARQAASGYHLAFAAGEGGAALGVAGFRVGESLAWGRHLYVDDLVTDASARSRGVGQALFAWLVDHARAAGCAQLHLDSGVQRFEAHRFYLRQRMRISSHHFALEL